MLAFGDRDDDRHLRRAIFRKPRRHVDELKELEAVDPTLRLRDATQLVRIPLAERELAADDVFVDRYVAFDGDGAEDRLRPGVCRDRQPHARVARAGTFDDAHAAVWKAVVAQLGHGHVVRREDEPLVARRARRDRKPRLQPLDMLGRYAVEPVEDDLLHDRGLAFVDLNRDCDFVVRVVQLDVDADDFRPRISAIGIKRLDALHVAIELGAIEKALARPRQEAVLARRENRFQLAGRHRARAAERDRRHLHVTGLAARRRGRRDEHDGQESSHGPERSRHSARRDCKGHTWLVAGSW